MKYARLLIQIFFKIWPQDNEVELLYNYPIRFSRYFPFQQNIHATSCEVNNNQYRRSDLPNPFYVVTNICKHKLAYAHFFKMADDCLTFSQLFARSKRNKRTKTKN